MANRIIVLCNYPFPVGMAPTSRILAYAQGFICHDLICEVLSFAPKARLGNEDRNSKSVVNGVTYHSSVIYDLSSSKLQRVFVDLRFSKLKTINLLIKERKKIKIDLVLISFDNLQHLLFFVPILWMLGFKLAFISDEFPPEIRKLRSKISFFNKFFYSIIHEVFLFRITMTKTLKDYYNKEFGDKPTYIMNTIVDTNRFNCKEVETKYIVFDKNDRIMLCYMGNMELEKDNVDNIIMAISLLKMKFPNIGLHLYGTPNEKARAKIENMIANYELESHVQYKGRIQSNEVPDVLIRYDVLVTSQPKTIRAAGGFPTKLGEYLMTGVPTIATDVGEINEYVKDGIHLFLVEPENPNAYAERLEYILKNYNQAIEIAMTAKAYVKDNFSCINVTKEVVSFINQNLINS